MTPDPMRATAERLAREVYDQYGKDNGDCYSPLSEQGEDDRERAILCALAGLTHRDRTAEREAASKAYMAGLSWGGIVSGRNTIAARDRYLAAEFDTGKVVEMANGDRVTYGEGGRGLGWYRGPSHNRHSLDWTLMFVPDTDTGADFDKLKAFAAEQRGAER